MTPAFLPGTGNVHRRPEARGAVRNTQTKLATRTSPAYRTNPGRAEVSMGADLGNGVGPAQSTAGTCGAFMLLVLFEARPQPGHHAAYREYAAVLQRTVGGGTGPVESGEYCSTTREGWSLCLTLWGREGAPSHLLQGVLPAKAGEVGLHDYRFRAGEVAFDTACPVPEPSTPHLSEASAVTLLSGTDLHTSGDSQRYTESLSRGGPAPGLVTWDVFEALHDPSQVLAVLSWRSQRDAQEFEQSFELPTGARMQRLHVTTDHRPETGLRRGNSLKRAYDREQERLKLLADAGAVVGATLDLVFSAQALADLLVPAFADAATVDVLDEVVSENAVPSSRRTLRRVASRTARLATPPVNPSSAPGCAPLPSAHATWKGPARAVSPADDEFDGIYDHDVHSFLYIRDLRVRSVAVIPLQAPSGRLGLLTVYRWREPGTGFTDKELNLAQELARRTAAALSNARAYARERDTAVALRRASGPRSLPSTPALQIRHGLDPAARDGRWHDVIRLPGLRTALVVGDASAFGTSAAVVAARLRAAARALAALETAPQELLTRLNDLVVDLDPDLAPGPDDHHSTCLYLVYDPIQSSITFSVAGHSLPVVTPPGKSAQTLHGTRGPELGHADEKYSAIRLPIEPGTVIALTALSWTSAPPPMLQDALGQPGLDLDTCFRAAARNLAMSPDAAPLVLARTSVLDPDCTASWDLASDIAMVSTARALAERQLDVWGLGENVKFVTTLVVSELVTNAVRHATAPVTLRLMRQDALICEVSDGSSAAPYLQHALPSDEGGRGLLIVAEVVTRWGVRRNAEGKTIWTEQELDRSDHISPAY